jgi:dTDP-4-amino-4,6-dideoxygalactose transaminase
MNVPVFNLQRARERIAEPLAERWHRILEDTAFVGGQEVEEFERAFAGFLGAAGCVGVGNGTDALTLALRALDLGPEDEVLVPAFTFFATWESVVLAGGRPVAVDIDPETYLLDLEAAARAVGKRTVGMVGVHLYGCPMTIDAVDAFCGEHGLWFVEDAAQAHGASIGGRSVGTLGRLAAWSFYPSKNLGCFGDGGAVTSDDPELLERVRRLANHGQTGRYEHALVGTNSRLDALQAAVLNCRLPLLDDDNRRRGEIVEQYRSRLAKHGLVFQEIPESGQSAWHLATVRSSERDGLVAWLREGGIGSAIHYPRAIPEQPVLEGTTMAHEVPEASRAGREVVSLPLFPELTDEEVATVCDAVEGFFERRSQAR